MLTILSQTELRSLRSHLDSINTLLQNAQTLKIEASVTTPSKTKAAEVVLPVLPAVKSQPKTRKSSRKMRQALTERKVAEIKRLLQEKTMTAAAIARLYKVHLGTIYSIKWGKTWQHVSATTESPKLEIVEIRK